MWDKFVSFFSSNKEEQQSNQQKTKYPSYNSNNKEQFQQQNCNYNYSQGYGHNSQSHIKLLKPVDKQKKIVAVIVTFCSGSSYDHLFSQVEQKAEEGTQVLVYACGSGIVKEINQAFTSRVENEAVNEMVKYIKEVDADCVVFNWECSSGYSGQNFPEGTNDVMRFARMLIDRGHMVMFSDFSLKALIKDWDSKCLGPNPFVKVSEHSGNFKLEFNSKDLLDSPSAQLQIIGEMAAQGHCNVQAISGTIVYGINHKNSDHDVYKIKVLTVVTSLQHSPNNLCEVNGKKGNPGHVLLTYKSGGHLLTSMGHWIELMKVDTSEKVLFDIAARQYGEQKVQQMQMEYNQLGTAMQKQAYISRNAVEFVQCSAPCANMSKKARNKF